MEMMFSFLEQKYFQYPFTVIDAKSVFLMKQKHTDEIAEIRSEKDLANLPEAFDGVVTTVPGYYGITTADCVPLVIRFPGGLCVLHAGWQGMGKRIIRKAFEQLENNYQVKKPDCDVWIGPHICGQCYKLQTRMEGGDGREMVFLREFGDDAVRSVGGEFFLDLTTCARKECEGAKKVEFDGRCTFEDKTLPSFFRDQTTMRIVSIVKC